MKKDLTKITDLSQKEILEIIAMAFRYKNGELGVGEGDQVLKGKVVAMVFEKPSLRTKVAFEVATAKLGGIPVYLTSGQIMASGNNEKGRESIPDIAKNLERFADLILARVYSHDTIQAIGVAVENADVVYTDTFISMGEEDMKLEKMKSFHGYQVDKFLLDFAKPDAIFMHCLPAHRGEEVTDEVMDCTQSVVFDQAECRMHIAKALLTFYLQKYD